MKRLENHFESEDCYIVTIMNCVKMIFIITLNLILFVNAGDQTQYSAGSPARDRVHIHDNTEPEICEFEVSNKSRKYFDDRLKRFQPKFIKFELRIKNKTEVNKTVQRRMFKPDIWFWTSKTNHKEGHFPYMQMNIDGEILSFNLLNSITAEIDYITLKVKTKSLNASVPCIMEIGNTTTNTKIAEALKSLIDNEIMEKEDNKLRQVVDEKNYFCYLVENAEFKNSWLYTLALYFNYPQPLITYECCEFHYSYIDENFTDPKCDIPIKKWPLLNQGSYFLGLIILMYFPILLCQLFEIVAKDEAIKSYDYDGVALDRCLDNEEELNKDFVFSDGSSPLSLFEALTRICAGVTHGFPRLTSRFRRLCMLMMLPCVVYVRLCMYSDGIGEKTNLKITVGDFAERGTPIEFLALLADNITDMRKCFVPYFGGPIGMLVMYHVLGIMIAVVPSSLKQVVENGMPTQSSWSPLFLNVDEVLRMAMFHPHTEPGYNRAATVCKARFVMLFTGEFWKYVFHIQFKRFRVFGNGGRCARAIATPFLFVTNVVEVLLCLVYYGLPFVSFSLMVIKGGVKSLIRQRTDIQQYRNSILILRAPMTWLIVWIFYFVAFSLFFYTVSVIFLASFDFISRIILSCLIAVVFMPSQTFGYVFFVVIFIYYVFHLIGDFGAGYTELLAIAVERSLDLDMKDNNVTFLDGHLHVRNVLATNIRSLWVNDQCIDTPEASLKSIPPPSEVKRKTRERRNAHGIPRDLFEYLIKRHRPVHIQVRIQR